MRDHCCASSTQERAKNISRPETQGQSCTYIISRVVGNGKTRKPISAQTEANLVVGVWWPWHDEIVLLRRIDTEVTSVIHVAKGKAACHEQIEEHVRRLRDAVVAFDRGRE